MESNNLFHPTRFFLLLKEEFTTKYRTALIALGAVVIATIFFATILEQELHENWFPTLLLGGGFVFSSMAFNNWVTKPGRQFYLHLPASQLEKFTSKWLVTAIIFPLVIIALYQLIVNFMLSIKYEGGNYFSITPFELFHPDNWILVKVYVVLQTIFLLGAVAFNRYAFLKTLFTLFVIGVTLAIFTFICVRLTFAEYWSGFEPIGYGPKLNQGFQDWVEGPFTDTIEKLFWWVLGPLALVIGFIKLKEKEV